MALQGNLKDMSLANLIQVNCQAVRTARLSLTHQGQTAAIFIADGQVVHAENGSQQGDLVLYQALAWDDGTFTVDTDVPSPARTIQTPWSALLLEGMKRVAEMQKTQDNSAMENTSDSKPNADMLQRLKKIDGVAGVVLASSDGVVLNSDIPQSDGEREAAVAVFIGGAARQLSESLQLGKFQHGIVLWEKQRVLVVETPDHYYGLVLGEHSSPAIVANAVAQLFK